ncbi:MAG: hypothetical protein EOP09_08425 [Proteobacteria bacterium]|nr:MAG: hypothetical protein EOP09_08425 [Pseudomonadota bacterium]
MSQLTPDDNIQHGIDDDPTRDDEKAAALGAIGGTVVGAIAGSMAGPVGTIIGGLGGGALGAGASGLAVGEVDKHDNDNNLTGLGDGVTRDVDDQVDGAGNRVSNRV